MIITNYLWSLLAFYMLLLDMSLTLYWNLGSQPARSVKCLIDIAKLDVKYVTLDVIKN